MKNKFTLKFDFQRILLQKIKTKQRLGELTFKTTKKKTEDDEEGSKVGFQKEDVRACYMHFIMFFIMLVTILFAVVKGEATNLCVQ